MQPESLIGKQLKNGWTIEDRHILSHHATGGSHSLGYIAKHPDGQQAFIKLLDPTLNRELDPIKALTDYEHRIFGPDIHGSSRLRTRNHLNSIQARLSQRGRFAVNSRKNSRKPRMLMQ